MLILKQQFSQCSFDYSLAIGIIGDKAGKPEILVSLAFKPEMATGPPTKWLNVSYQFSDAIQHHCLLKNILH